MKSTLVCLGAIVLAAFSYSIGFNNGDSERQRIETEQRLRHLVQLFNTAQHQDSVRMSNNLCMLIYSAIETRDELWKKTPIPGDLQSTYFQADAIRKMVKTNIVHFDLNWLKKQSSSK